MNMKSIIAASVASGAVAFGASAAMAGGVIAPVVDVAPIIATPVASSWDGLYVGGALGYSFRGDDRLGFDTVENGEITDRVIDITNLRVSGPTYGVHAGYRWQRDSWIFGPELSFEGGSVKDRFSASDIADGVLIDASVESKVNSIISLVMKTGYLVQPQTMVYGSAGLARGDFDYIISATEFDGASVDSGSLTQGYTRSGYVLGLGVEHLVNARTSVFAEYQRREFGKETVDLGDDLILRTRPTPSHSNIKVGVNFRF